MRSRRGLFTLLALFTLLLFTELPGSWLAAPDEARYAEIPREMLASGDFVTPRLNGTHYFEKPPLLYWANAASMRLFGLNAFAARLPTRLAAIGTAVILIVGLGGATLPTWGWWAALIYLSAPLSFVLGRFNLTDGVLTFGMTLSFFALRAFLQRREEERPARGALALLGLGVGLAMLTKGLIAIVFPGLVFLLWVAIVGRWKRLGELLLSPAPVVFVLVTVPWFILMERANPGFSRFFFIHEHVARFATAEAKRGGPIYYFVLAFIVGFLPWIVLFGRSLAPVLTRHREQLVAHRDELFFALWFITILVFFSLSHSKLLPYILPAIPAAAALVGKLIARSPLTRVRTPLAVYAACMTIVVAGGVGYGVYAGVLARYQVTGLALLGGALLLLGAWGAVQLARRSGHTALQAAAAGWGGLYLALILALPHVSEDLSGRHLAVLAQQAHAEQVVAYKVYPQIFPWVLRSPIVVAAYQGELSSDDVLPPERFWSGEEFWRRWESPERLVVVVRKRNLAEFREPGQPLPHALGDNQQYILLSNFTPTS